MFRSLRTSLGSIAKKSTFGVRHIHNTAASLKSIVHELNSKGIAVAPPMTMSQMSMGTNANGSPCYTDLCDAQINIKPGDELSFAWITPRSLIRGLEGGILARLLAQPNIRLAGARMFSPSEEFVGK